MPSRVAVGAAGLAAAVAVGVVATSTNNAKPTATRHRACSITNDRPARRCTPGTTDPRVTQSTIQTTICISGYTRTVRSVPAALKAQVLAEYGLTPATFHGEIDHFISLELGGSNDIKNLWPESGPIPNPKDAVENRLHRAICSGAISLTQAQTRIRTDWHTATGGLK